MSYRSIDALQRALADSVFTYAQDRKKAAGRALGTLVEVVTYYALRTWNLEKNIVIERRVPEFANPTISHNVEFSLHRVRSQHAANVAGLPLPLTGAKVRRVMPILTSFGDLKRQAQLVTSKNIKRNAAILADSAQALLVANVDTSTNEISVCQLNPRPFAIVECKRVGVEEGMTKGPQTIEKAKQGAYVARSVSALQKVRLRSGQFQGFVEREDGSHRIGPYAEVLQELLGEEGVAVSDFILTVGVVSNHGNWFTSDNQNKELRVLSQSYDWLLFLTDDGLGEFIEGLLLSPPSHLEAVGHAFRNSYTGRPGANRFTKVRMDVDADRLLRSWFDTHLSEVDRWFNVISPAGDSLESLRQQLRRLAGKELVA